jgi:long-chain acyl-CoA synthetase
VALSNSLTVWRTLGAGLDVPAMPEATIASAFADAVARRDGRTALREKRLGLWRSIGWRTYGERARNVGLALMAMGFERGDRACIIGDNCPEWLYADMGIIGIGGISVGIYATDSAAQVAQLAADCGCRVIFVEDEEQLDKVLQVRDRLAYLERIVVFDMEGLADFADPMAVSLADFEKQGRDRAGALEEARRRRVAETRPSDVALLIYTSGTTGPPKGAMLTHANIVFQAAILHPVMPLGPDDSQLSFLPLCHIAERLLSIFRPIFAGSVVNFAESQETVPENIREISPTVFFGVPRIWEKFFSAATIAAKDGTRFERWAFDAAIAVGHRAAQCRLNSVSVPLWLRVAHPLARATVLLRARKLIGMERTNYVVTGAAPISPDLIAWFFAIGLDMREAYGMTETAGVATFPPPERRRIGTVGRALPGTELKLSAEGEILVCGPHIFAGYWGLPTKTAETLIDGWLNTGDIGALDDEGFLRVVDRMKDIIITAGGKNVSPSEIENQLKFSPFIADAVVVGDRRKYLTALIMIDHDNVAKFAQDHDVPFTNFASLCRAPPVQTLIEGEVDRVNDRFARVERIKKFRLIDVQLTAEDEELTPTMKLKRKFVNERYRPLIEEMYADA